MCVMTTEKLLWLSVPQFLIQNRSLVCTYIRTSIYTTNQSWYNTGSFVLLILRAVTPFQLFWSSWILHKEGWKNISSIQGFSKRETATAFQPSVSTRLNLPLLHRNWVMVPCAGGAWEVESTASEWGCWARHAPPATHTAAAAPAPVNSPSIWRGRAFFKGELVQLHKGLRTFFTDIFANYLLNYSACLLNKGSDSAEFSWNRSRPPKDCHLLFQING